MERGSLEGSYMSGFPILHDPFQCYPRVTVSGEARYARESLLDEQKRAVVGGERCST